MARTATTRSRTSKVQRARSRTDARALDRLIEEATVDAYDESEQRTGFYTMLEENLEMPFGTEVLGVEVTVERIHMNDGGEIVAVCTRGRTRQAIAIIDLPLPVPPPRGAEWIDAYRRWSGHR